MAFALDVVHAKGAWGQIFDVNKQVNGKELSPGSLAAGALAAAIKVLLI